MAKGRITMIKLFKRALVTFALSGLSSMAFAQSTVCVSPLSLYQSCLATPGCDASYYVSNHPECFPGGSTTSTIEINATSFAQAAAVSRAIASRLNPLAGGPVASVGTTGISAGSQPQAWNVWGNIDQSNTDFSYTANAAVTKGGNDVTNSVIGIDYALSPQMVVGVSAAFDRGDGWGFRTAKTTTDADGYLIAPYLGYQLSKDLALDVSLGLGSGDFSNSSGVKSDGDRWFGAANLTYASWMGNVQLTGKASYLHGEEDFGNSKLNGVKQANTDSTTKLDQIRLGAQAGYWMDGVMPFIGLAYTSDVNRSSSTPGNFMLGRDAFVWSLGVNFFSLSSKITGGLMYQVESNRDNSDNDVLTANVNFRF
jgi:hypothetical protein